MNSPTPGNDAHHRAEGGGRQEDLRELQHLEEAAVEPARQLQRLCLLVPTDEQHEGLRKREQAEHDDDQVDAGGQPALPEGEALGVADGLDTDRLQEYAETKQRAGGHVLPAMGDDDEHHA